MVRALFIGAFFLTVTPLLISLQWLLDRLHLPGWGFISCNYYRVLCFLLRIRVRMAGAPMHGRAVLFVCNHVSWVDIVVIGSIAPIAFVAKREVAGRIRNGVSVVLFAEGTSSDGNRVLPFRSALLGAVEEAGSTGEDRILIQPMSIGYIGQHGIPMGRQHRPLVAWYGDLDFVPHIRTFIERGAVDAVVSYGEPAPADCNIDRKAITKQLESTVRQLSADALRGPAPIA
jgi:lyso-ornithine lipid O-acyltransferase